MTRDSSAAVLLQTLDRLGVSAGRIDLPDVWPTLAAWWSTPVIDLGPAEVDELGFLLSLAPAADQAHVFAGPRPAALTGRELVRLDFERSFHELVDGVGRVRISGGAGISFWYGYDAAWQQLRETSDWIEMGYSTPQIDEFDGGRDPGGLIRYVEGSGVLAAAADQPALALLMLDHEGDERMLVVGDRV